MSFTGKPQLTVNTPITNDGFWPDLVVGDLVEKYRVPAEYDDGVIETGLIMAMTRVNKKLAGVKLQATNPDPKCGDGSTGSPRTDLTAKASLLEWAEAYSEGEVNGELVAIHMYKHAVFCTAKAFLLQQYNTMRRKKQEDTVKREMPDEHYWLDQAQQGISWLFENIAPCLQTTSNAGVYVALI